MYSSFAKHFDETRYKPWSGVVQFLNGLESNTSVLDLGCGNGKYMGVRSDLNLHGCDICPELVTIAQSKYPTLPIQIADGQSLPYASESMQTVYSIAVFHHMKSIDDRIAFLNEVARILKPSGQFFLTVWSPAAIRTKWIQLNYPGDFSVPWRDKYSNITISRFYHIFEKVEIETILKSMFEVEDIWEECENWYVRCKRSK